VFSAIRPLNNQEADIVIQMRNTLEVARVLADEETPALPAPQQQASPFEQPGPAPVQVAATNASPLGATNVAPMKAATAANPAGGGAPHDWWGIHSVCPHCGYDYGDPDNDFGPRYSPVPRRGRPDAATRWWCAACYLDDVFAELHK